MCKNCENENCCCGDNCENECSGGGEETYKVYNASKKRRRAEGQNQVLYIPLIRLW